MLLGAHPLLKGNKDGIAGVNVDAVGVVTSIQRSTGEVIRKTEGTHVGAFLTILLYPAFGFLIPWGVLRILTWVVSGFSSPPAPL
jgi:hypothetical protein